MDNTVVYFHIRPSNNKVFYVGVGTSDRPNSKHNRNQYWHNVVNKEGGFIINIRHRGISKELAFYFERKYIKFFGRAKYDMGGVLVNLGVGGEGTSGFKMSDEARKRISETSKITWADKERLARRVLKMIGRKHSEETKKKMSINTGARSEKELTRRRNMLLKGDHPMTIMIKTNHPFLGRHHTDESKNKIKLAKVGKNMSRLNYGSKPILQYDLEGKFIKRFDCGADATREVGVDSSCLSMALNGKRPRAKGYIWKFENNSK